MGLNNTIFKHILVCVSHRKTMGNKGEANIYTVHKINIYSNAAEYEYFNIWQTSAISQQQTLNVAYLRFCPLGELDWLEKTKTETSEAKEWNIYSTITMATDVFRNNKNNNIIIIR